MTDNQLIAEVARVWVDGGGDAEGLRCAEKLYEEYFYGNDDEKAIRHNRVLARSIHNAVRAEKEARDDN